MNFIKTLSFIFVFSVLGWSHPSQAQDAIQERQIVILTSIEEPTKKGFLRRKPFSIEKYVEKKYKKEFLELGYKIHIEHKASQVTLQKYLESDETLALFWISHSAESRSLTKGIKAKGKVMDIDGNNVVHLFQKANPNIALISIVGCQSQGIIEEFLTNEDPEATEIQGFKEKKRVTKAVKQSIKKSRDVLVKAKAQNNEQVKNDHTPLASKAETHRKVFIGNIPQGYSAQIFTKSTYLGLVSNERKYFYIPKSLLTGSKLKIIVKPSLRYMNSAPEMSSPKVNFYTDFFQSTVRAFSDRDGNMIGSTMNIYYVEI